MPEPQTPQLAFEKVSFAFDETPVLRDISFELQSGETLIVLGAAGSGKTVLLKTALGLLRPTQGRVVLFGADVTTDSEREWFDIRSRIGVLFQEGGLFDSLDVAENVAYPLRNQTSRQCPEAEIMPKVEESLKFVDLGQTLDKYPSELSGGMRRRVGIARSTLRSGHSTAPPFGWMKARLKHPNCHGSGLTAAALGPNVARHVFHRV